MTVSVVLPAYREAENLREILPRIHDALNGLSYEVLVIDTMEPMDETETICKANDAVYVKRQGGNDYGDAIRTGFAQACGEYTVVMDADGSHDPADILRLYEIMKAGECDLVIGSRYCRGGSTDNSFILRMMSWMLNVAYRVLFGLKVKDVSDSFRMYTTSQIKALTLECENFDVVEEILIKLVISRSGYVVKEVPISFKKRSAGESKRDLVRFIRSYLQTVFRLMKIKHRAKRM